MKPRIPKGIDDALDVEPIEIELEDTEIVSKGTTEDIIDDYKEVRQRLMTAIIRTGEVLDEAVKAVKADGSARAVEAAGNVVRALSENATKLLDLHEKIRKIEKESKATDGANSHTSQTPQPRAVGTMKDMLKVVKNG